MSFLIYFTSGNYTLLWSATWGYFYFRYLKAGYNAESEATEVELIGIWVVWIIRLNFPNAASANYLSWYSSKRYL